MTDHPHISDSRTASPHRTYFGAAILIGALLLLITPPMQVPDEGAHFERAWQISEGTVIPLNRPSGTGGMLPVSINDMCRWFEQFNHDPHAQIPNLWRRYGELLQQPVRADERMFIPFSNTAAYPPVPYLPQAAGILVGRWCGASVLACLLLARVFNLISAAAIYSTAVRVAPFQKWTIVLLGLTPMSLFLMASASSDAVTNSVCALFVATVLRLAYSTTGEPHPGETFYSTLSLLSLAALLGVVKQGYYPLVMLALLIPWQRRRLQGRLVGASFGAVLTTAITVASWAWIVHSTYSPMAPRVDPEAQLDFILSHPVDFSRTLLTRLFAPKFVLWHAEQFLGFLGTLDTPLPGWLLVIHGAAILTAAARETAGTVAIPGVQRGWIALVLLVNFALLAVTIYLTWMGVGANDIRVQGRYLIPLGIPFCAMLNGAWPTSGGREIRWPRVMGLFFVAETVVVVSTLVRRYYVL